MLARSAKLTVLSVASTSLIVSVPLAVWAPSSATAPVKTPPSTGASSAPVIVTLTVALPPSLVKTANCSVTT